MEATGREVGGAGAGARGGMAAGGAALRLGGA